MLTIVKGTYVEVPFALLDADGNAVDMTVSGRSLVLRLRLSTDTAVTITKTTGTSGEYSWTSQAGGTGKFVFSTTSTGNATAGDYNVEVCYIATSESKKHIVYGPTKWAIVAPSSGAL